MGGDKINFKNCKKAVSNIVGYSLTLAITAFVATTSILLTNSVVDEKYIDSATVFATNIANKVSDAIINIGLMQENYPYSNYSTNISIPSKLVDKFYYYVEVTNNKVFVNSTDGRVSVNNTLYNVSDRLFYDISGVSNIGSNNINIFFNKTEYIDRYDFGSNSSEGKPNFIRVSKYTDNSDGGWDLPGWKYRTVISVDSPFDKPVDDYLTYYQVLLQLNKKNFDFTKVNSDASDIRFIDKDSGNELYFWIERWYPDGSYTTRIWVNVTDVDIGKNSIHMYYGNPDASITVYNDPYKTFNFFDDFETDLGNWSTYTDSSKVNSIVELEDGKLVLSNGSSVIANYRIDPDGEGGGLPVIIETKAKSVSLGKGKEASVFARSSGADPSYYKDAYVLSSNSIVLGDDGNNGNYMNAIKYNALSGWTAITSNEDKQPMDDKWNRLRYILNGSDNVIARYNYLNFDVDSFAAFSNGLTGENFGLCTVNSGVKAYYDWVLVRRFAQKTNIQGGSKSDREPYPFINQTQSKNFGWDDQGTPSPDDDDFHKVFIHEDSDPEREYIYGSEPATFVVSNLYGGYYSMVFSVGDGQSIDNMKIQIDGDGNSLNDDSISGISTNSYKIVWISNIYVSDPADDGSGELKITFSDPGGVPNKWAVGWMSLEKGNRIIELKSK